MLTPRIRAVLELPPLALAKVVVFTLAEVLREVLLPGYTLVLVAVVGLLSEGTVEVWV